MGLREAVVEQDRPALRRLWGEYLAWVNRELHERYGISFPIGEILERNLADLAPFTPPAGRLLLAEDAEDTVGIGCLQRLNEDVGEVKRMYVQPHTRGRGIGRRLLHGLLDGAHEAGYRTVRLDSVRFMHAAHALYRSADFEEIEPYPESEIPPEYWPYWVFMELTLEPDAARG